MGRGPILKKKSISKVLQITKKCDLIDIWRVKNLYKFCKFTVSFSKIKTKSMREKKLHLEKKLELLERKLNCNEAKDEYFCKENLNVIYSRWS